MEDINLLDEKICLLFERDLIFLNPNLNLSHLSKVLGVKFKTLKDYFGKEMDYSLSEMLGVYRYAYFLKISKEVTLHFENIWILCGFKSKKDFFACKKKVAFFMKKN